jgi:hypothetical protein
VEEEAAAGAAAEEEEEFLTEFFRQIPYKVTLLL